MAAVTAVAGGVAVDGGDIFCAILTNKIWDFCLVFVRRTMADGTPVNACGTLFSVRKYSFPANYLALSSSHACFSLFSATMHFFDNFIFR